MPKYCVELYLPRVAAARLEAAAGDARLAAEALARDGVSIRYLRTTYLAEDETCFHLFDADCVDDVAEAAERLELRGGRITRVVEHAAASVPGHVSTLMQPHQEE